MILQKFVIFIAHQHQKSGNVIQYALEVVILARRGKRHKNGNVLKIIYRSVCDYKT